MKLGCLVLVACSSAAPPPLANVQPRAREGRAVLFQHRHVDWAVVLGCAGQRGLDGDVGRCLDVIDAARPAGNAIGHTVPIGKRDIGGCENTPTTHDVIATAKAVDDDYWMPDVVDPRSEVLVWPASDVVHLITWSTDLHGFDVATAQRLLDAARLKRYPDGSGPPGGVPVPRHVVHADFDGDGRLDKAWTVDGNAGEYSYNGIIVELTTRAEPILARSSDLSFEAIAAIDVDRDGRAELVIVEHFASAFNTQLARYTDGAFIALRERDGTC